MRVNCQILKLVVDRQTDSRTELLLQQIMSLCGQLQTKPKTKAFLRQIPLQKSTMSYSLSNQIEQGWCISYNITCDAQTIDIGQKKLGGRGAEIEIDKNKSWRRYSLGLLWWP